MELDPVALQEVFDEIDSIGMNACFYAIADESTAREIVLDALRQLINIHIYASYDKKFEVDDAEHLYDIVHLNMGHELRGESWEALCNWLDDVAMHLAVGAISLDAFIKPTGEASADE